MHCELIGIKGTWKEIQNSCRGTIGLGETSTEVSPEWKRKLLLAEHSPIRQLIIKAKWYNLPYWVSVHITRHKIGIEHFVRTQRTDRTGTDRTGTDRTGTDRNNLLQGALVEHEIEVNAQAIINISRKRLCNQASLETREAWRAFLNTFKNIEPELFYSCKPDCIYRNGICPEMKPCGMRRELK